MGFSNVIEESIIEIENFLEGKGEYKCEQYTKETINKIKIVIKVLNCLYHELFIEEGAFVPIESLLPKKETKEIMKIYEEISGQADKIEELHKKVVKYMKEKFMIIIELKEKSEVE